MLRQRIAIADFDINMTAEEKGKYLIYDVIWRQCWKQLNTCIRQNHGYSHGKHRTRIQSALAIPLSQSSMLTDRAGRLGVKLRRFSVQQKSQRNGPPFRV